MARFGTGDMEEGENAYRPGSFHPVYVSDVLKQRYKVLNKIGFGRYSTVWLVRDLLQQQVVKSFGRYSTWLMLLNRTGDKNEFLALKVLGAEYHNPDQPVHERGILTQLRNGDRRQVGYVFVCYLVDDFEHQGINGVHICRLFELIGETLRSFGA